MTRDRILELVNFFYSSDTSADVPCRIALTFGMSGVDLSADDLIEFLTILSNSSNLKSDLRTFIEKMETE